MLTWSTSALASLPTLSSRLPFNQALFPRARLAAGTCLQRSRSFATPHRPQSMLKEQIGPDSLDVSATSSRLRPRPAASANGTPHLSRLPTFFGIPVDQNVVLHSVDTDLPSDALDRQQFGSVSSHSALGPTDIKWTARRRRTLLWLMLTAKSAEQAWAAYLELLSHRAAIPNHSLRRLVRLLASIKPRTRTVHLQLLSVLKTLQRSHGRLRLWEWNTLIDSAGKQWRKTRLEDYENALDIFNKKGALPVAHTVSTDEVVDQAVYSCATQQDPDIWTYNILLSIASRSNLPPAVRHASSLLTSGLSRNRYTHLCLLRYFTVRNDLHSVRSTLDKMKQQGLELGLDGINACLWAYAWNRRLDVALPIYRLLRSNVEPAPCPDDDKLGEDARYVHDTVGLDIPDGLVPDTITYTMMIQSLAYHGDLKNALGVFVDMLSTPNREADGGSGACYRPSMAAFRGLFLGFARHGRDSEHRPTEAEIEMESVAALFPSVRGSWDLDALETVFAAFMQLPSHPKPTPRIVYWILVAFDKTSGRDTAKLCEIWEALEAKYGGGWGGRLEDIRLSIFGLAGDSVKARESHDD